MIHPLSRNEDVNAYYYAFNTADEEGCQYLEAIASFLAERYSGKEATPRQMKDQIMALLDGWKEKQPPELGKGEKKVDMEK